jgi:RNA polymerase sigma-70 factor, ECF subfamily
MSETRELLTRWHHGDADALATLVEQDRDWIERRVRARLGALLRQRHDTQDIVQQTLVEVLRYGPRFVLDDRNHLRGLLARIVENTLRGRAAHELAERRDLRRELPREAPRTGNDTEVLDLEPTAGSGPVTAAAAAETADWVRLAVELLDGDDRSVVLWRHYEELSYAEIGQRLGVSEDAVRMRHQRALPKLARCLERLQQGQVGSALADGEAP